MDKSKQKQHRRSRRRKQIRRDVSGTPDRPRLCVYRSLRHFHAQVIDDLAGRTLVAASSQEKGFDKGKSGAIAGAAEVGKALADRAQKAGIKAVVFDRGGFRYHGRVKAFADAARKGGLNF